jgi:CCR4-NOT transcription complex subunit 7/8
MYDVKYLMKSCKILKGGLQSVADTLQVHSPLPVQLRLRRLTPSPLGGDPQVQRVGIEHTGGSDAILTGSVFFKMLEVGAHGWRRLAPIARLDHAFGARFAALL